MGPVELAAAPSLSNVKTAVETRWKAMHWLSQRRPIRGPNWVDMLMWESLSCVICVCRHTTWAKGHVTCLGRWWGGSSCSGRTALVWGSWMRKQTSAIISNSIFIPECPIRSTIEVFLSHVCHFHLHLVSPKCCSPFIWNWVRNWHISTPWLCSTVERTALEGFPKMCLKRYPSVMLQQ